MRSKVMSLIATGAIACGFATPSISHHSSAMFDRSKEVVLQGTVREFQWTAPHVWIQIDVTDGATRKVVQWGVEATNPMALGRQGWKRSSFKPGDRVTVTVHPHRNGSPIAAFVRATLADGSTLGDRPAVTPTAAAGGAK